MSSIDEFPDEPKYTIKTVCAQTGIRAVTLRAWERRHEVLTPHRAENRYRLYSDRDVAILRWIKSRVDNGISISRAADELHNLERSGVLPEAVPDAPAAHPIRRDIPPEFYIRNLFEALIKHDEPRAGELFHEIQTSFDLTTILTDILTPTLQKIGEAWYQGDIRITTEHFASAYIRGKLLTLLQAYPMRRGAPYILIGCAPTEQHEIPSLMVAVMLRKLGYRVEFLGADIPVDDLVDYASYEKPAMIVLSASMEAATLEMKHIQERLNKLRMIPLFGFAGRAFVTKPALIKNVPGIYLGNTIIESVDNIRTLLSNTGKAPIQPSLSQV